jgi:S1-C subfamily serine protease
MNYIASILLMVTLITSCAMTPDEEGDIPSEIVQWSVDNVWRIHSRGGSGSGFAYDNETMVTACHVARGADEIFVTNGSDTRLIYMRVQSCDEDRDVAILKTLFPEDSLDASGVLIYSVPFGKGVYGPGFSLGMNLLITSGNMGLRAEGSGIKNAAIISAPTIMGDSGSPALALVNGEVIVVGLRVAIRAVPLGFGGSTFVTHLTIITPAANIRHELRKA